MGSDAEGKTLYFARAFNGEKWTICSAYSYDKDKDEFVQASPVGYYNDNKVIFDDGSKPIVKKTSTPYQAQVIDYTYTYCGFYYLDSDLNNEYYRCSGCQNTAAVIYNNWGSGQEHYIAHPFVKTPAKSATRSYEISWVKSLGKKTLTEISGNSNKYNSTRYTASLFSDNDMEDSIITINSDNTVKIEWYATGIDSGICDKVWTY